MAIKEEIKRTKTGYIVKTEVEASESELKQHLAKIVQMKSDYEKEIKDLTSGIDLTEEQKALKDNLDKIDEYRALELHKSKVGNVDKRIRDLNEAIQMIDTQIKNREVLLR